MTSNAPAPSRARPTPRFLAAGTIVVIVAIVGTFASQWMTTSTSTATSPIATAPLARDGGRDDAGVALGEADGATPDGTSVFDDEIPAVANLDPALLESLRRAASDAAHDGIRLYVESGWRSPAYQEQLFRAAVSEYGSEAEAARWVATPNTSAHVSGNAVDIAPFDATAWLSEQGADYALCPIYRNEPWHFELRRRATDHGCPPLYADPTYDPRMRAG